MNHRKMFQKLIQDEHIQDNLTAHEDFQPSQEGNTAMYIGYVGVPGRKFKKGVNAGIMLEFDKKGKLFGISVATKPVGKKFRRYAVAAAKLVE